jgi:hypothetical protein
LRDGHHKAGLDKTLKIAPTASHLLARRSSLDNTMKTDRRDHLHQPSAALDKTLKDRTEAFVALSARRSALDKALKDRTRHANAVARRRCCSTDL